MPPGGHGASSPAAPCRSRTGSSSRYVQAADPKGFRGVAYSRGPPGPGVVLGGSSPGRVVGHARPMPGAKSPGAGGGLPWPGGRRWCSLVKVGEKIVGGLGPTNWRDFPSVPGERRPPGVSVGGVRLRPRAPGKKDQHVRRLRMGPPTSRPFATGAEEKRGRAGDPGGVYDTLHRRLPGRGRGDDGWGDRGPPGRWGRRRGGNCFRAQGWGPGGPGHPGTPKKKTVGPPGGRKKPFHGRRRGGAGGGGAGWTLGPPVGLGGAFGFFLFFHPRFGWF